MIRYDLEELVKLRDYMIKVASESSNSKEIRGAEVMASVLDDKIFAFNSAIRQVKLEHGMKD